MQQVFKFKLNGLSYSAEWNESRNGVNIKREDLMFCEFFIHQDDDRNINVEPYFNWRESNEKRVELGRFLEGTNLYELLKPKQEI